MGEDDGLAAWPGRQMQKSSNGRVDREIMKGRRHLEKWWRRGESEYSGLLKTRKLLIFRDAQNALASEIAPNWNVSGTRPRSLFWRHMDRAASLSFRPRAAVH